MERYHTIVKIERIRQELQQGEFDKAYETASKINVDKLKSMSDLSLIAETYVHVGRFEEAKNYYLKIYGRTHSKRILSKLVHVYIKLGDAAKAERYLSQYDELAPKDFYRHIFRYNLYKIEGRNVHECIPVLEALKDVEYIDHWAYELAKMYHKAGEKEQCITECNDIILWFGEGKYVEKAKALKAYYNNNLHITLAGEGAKVVAEEIKRKIIVQEDNESPSEDDFMSDISKGIESVVEELTKTIEIPKSFERKKTVRKDNNQKEGKNKKEAKEVSDNKANIKVDNKSKHINDMKDIMSDEEFEKTIYELLEEELANKDDQKTEVPKEIQTLFTYPELPEDIIDFSELEELNNIIREKDISLEELLGSFLHIPLLRDQLNKSLKLICSNKINNTNIIITGDKGQNGLIMLFAKRMTKVLYNLELVKSNKVALINADKINGMELSKKKNRLMDCCIIIENAGTLNKNAVTDILSLCDEAKGSIAVILEDIKADMNQMLKKHPEVTGIFSNRINLPKYSITEWKQYLYEKFKEQDYDLDVKAESLLELKINGIINSGDGDVFELINEFARMSIKKAEKRNSELLIQLSTDLKFDSTQLMIISEEDLA